MVTHVFNGLEEFIGIKLDVFLLHFSKWVFDVRDGLTQQLKVSINKPLPCKGFTSSFCSEIYGSKGIIQTDGYAVYETLFKDGILNPRHVTHVGCRAHARREFWRAETIGQSEKAGEVIALIQKLYRIEKPLANVTDIDRVATRQIKAIPVLNKIRNLIESFQNDPKTLPARQLSKACAYALRRWDELIRLLSARQRQYR